MKRLALFIVFLSLLGVGGVACGGGAPVQAETEPGSLLGIKDMSPIEPTSDPTVYDGSDYIRDQNATAEATRLTPAPTLQPATATPDPLLGVKAFHTVASGDMLSSIAQRWACTEGAIQAANSDLIVDPDVMQIGWVLKIPANCN